MDKIKFVRGNKNNIDKIKEFLYSQGARKDGSTMIGYDFGDNEFGFYVGAGNVVKRFSYSCDEMRFLMEEHTIAPWRGKLSELYYYITDGGDIYSKYDDYRITSNDHYNFNNYFESYEEAQTYRDTIKRILKSRHEA